MDRDMNILYILGVPLGYVMEWIYNLIPNYGWDIIIFTIVIRLLSIPLQLNQQKLSLIHIYPALPEVHQPGAGAELPLFTLLQPVRHRGHPHPRLRQRAAADGLSLIHILELYCKAISAMPRSV